MRIGIIGGLDRNARELTEMTEARGHRLETHNGVLAGSASVASLRALVVRSDLILVLTDVNSHNAVQMARRVARQHHRPLRIMRRLGPSHLAAFLQACGPTDAPARGWAPRAPAPSTVRPPQDAEGAHRFSA